MRNAFRKWIYVSDTVASNVSMSFQINGSTGEISNIESIDYEATQTIRFYVHVRDDSIDTGVSCIKNFTQVTDGIIDKIEVVVHILDVNDNPPEFINDRIATGMIHGTEQGTQLELKLKVSPVCTSTVVADVIS